jgi:hypothetical protein
MEPVELIKKKYADNTKMGQTQRTGKDQEKM